jgi:hypothetical protein
MNRASANERLRTHLRAAIHEIDSIARHPCPAARLKTLDELGAVLGRHLENAMLDDAARRAAIGDAA